MSEIETVRLTTAQALVRWMLAQRSQLLDGTEVPLFAGVFGIFGHGNVLGLATALHDVRDQLPTWRGQNEQGMALAAVGYARATDRRQVMVATTSVGPGALNMVTAAGVAHANRLPVLLLPGDTFAGRASDPVLQQVEHFGDPTTSVNDAFRPVSRYSDRIMKPEQLLSTLPQVAWVLTDPADAGPVVLALPQDVQAEEYDFLVAMFAPRLHAVPRIRPDRDSLAAAAEIVRGAERPLLVLGGGVRYRARAPRPSRSPRSTGCRSWRPWPAAPWSRTTTRCTRAPWESSAPARPTTWPSTPTSCWPWARGCRTSPRRRGPASRPVSGWSPSTPPASTRSSTPPTPSSATPGRPSASSAPTSGTGPSALPGRSGRPRRRRCGTLTSTGCGPAG
ncbi:MAG: thiamine pyrophosphate-binding protein [Nocardioides sp.]